MFSRAWTKIDHVVSAADCFFVVLHHEDGVPEIAQGFKRGNQAVIVAVMQSYRRLVEHVEDAPQPGADLRRQANALSFAAGKSCRRAVERDISETHIVEKRQALDDFLHQP